MKRGVLASAHFRPASPTVRPQGCLAASWDPGTRAHCIFEAGLQFCEHRRPLHGRVDVYAMKAYRKAGFDQTRSPVCRKVRCYALLRKPQKIIEVPVISKHQVPDDNPAPAIAEDLDRQIDWAAGAASVSHLVCRHFSTLYHLHYATGFTYIETSCNTQADRGEFRTRAGEKGNHRTGAKLAQPQIARTVTNENEGSEHHL